MGVGDARERQWARQWCNLVISHFKYSFLKSRSTVNLQCCVGPRRTAKCFSHICACVHAKLLQLCLTVCNPIDCSLPGSSICGILQGRLLEWAIVSFCTDLPDPGIESLSPAWAGGFFATSTTWEEHTHTCVSSFSDSSLLCKCALMSDSL